MSQHDDDWNAEMQSHLDLRAEHGSTPDEASRRFGNRLQISEDVRAVRIPVLLDQFSQDLRYAWRGFLRSPLFSLTAVLVLALGIGAATAVFSVVDRILFRPLPYTAADRLVWLGMAAPIEANEFLLSPDYLAWRESQSVFTHLTATRGNLNCDLTMDDPVRFSCAQVDANFLATLGVTPLLGRDLSEADNSDVALISHKLWRSRYNSSPGLLNQTIELNRKAVRIVGVLPPGFELPTLQPFDFLQRMQIRGSQQQNRTMFFLTAFAQLKSGQTPEQAHAQLQPLFQEALKTVPPQFRKEVSLRVLPMRDRQTRDSRQSAIYLLAAVVLVLLITAANVANLLLARAHARQREWLIRRALGAGVGRMIRQCLTESFLLTGSGALFGLLAAVALLRVFVSLAPAGLPRLAEAGLDWRVLTASVIVAVVCAIVFGLAPFLQGRGRWFRPALVVTQIALTVILLAAAFSFLQALLLQLDTPLGLRSEQTLLADINLHQERYPSPEKQLGFFDSFEERLKLVPGIQAVAVADSVPPQDRAMTTIFSTLQVEGRPANTGSPTGGMVVHRQVSPAYFSILGISTLQGRAFNEEDRDGPEDVVVISQALARRLFPNQDPVGQRIRAFEGPYRPILGVVADVKNAGLTGKDDPEYYELRRHHPSAGRGGAFVLIHSSGDPAKLAPIVRSVLADLDPRMPVQTQLLTKKIADLTARSRFQSALLGGFAVMGLIVAAIGLYGVLSFLVARRSKEIAVRMALGATSAQVRSLVLWQADIWTAIGLCLGLAAAYAAQFREGLAPAVLVLAITALLAAWLPSERAAKVDPSVALRWE